MSAVEVSRLVHACRSRVTDRGRLDEILRGVSEYARAVGFAAAAQPLPPLPEGVTEGDVRGDAAWIRELAGVDTAELQAS